MTNNNKKNAYDNFKFLPEYYNYFILIDGSAQENKIPFIVYQIEQNPHIEPLFLHTPYEALQLSGPLLIQVTRNSPLLRWYFCFMPQGQLTLRSWPRTFDRTLKPFFHQVRQCCSVFTTRVTFAASGPALTVESATFSLVPQRGWYIQNRMRKPAHVGTTTGSIRATHLCRQTSKNILG